MKTPPENRPGILGILASKGTAQAGDGHFPTHPSPSLDISAGFGDLLPLKAERIPIIPALLHAAPNEGIYPQTSIWANPVCAMP